MKSRSPEHAAVNVGDHAPDFTLPSQNRGVVRLYDLLKAKCVVLYFYPRNFTYVCTKEACSFRDAYEDFVDAGAEVVGVSTASTRSHTRFAGKHQLPFILLSDRGGRVAKLYGASKLLGLMTTRVTLVIDQGGIIRCRYSALLESSEHVATALEIVRTCHGGPARDSE